MSVQTDRLYTDVFGLTDQKLICKIKERAEYIKLKKNVRFFHEGEVPRQVAFLMSGIVRGYTVDANGRDVTDCFCYQFGDPVIPGVPLGDPAKLNVETVAASELLYIPMEDVIALMGQYRELWGTYNRLLVRAYNEHLELKSMLYKCEARERYQWFLDRHPHIVGKVSNKHVASFLDMNPVTLSRLRRTLREERQGSSARGGTEEQEEAVSPAAAEHQGE